jgi:hypothetical protein
MLFWITKCAIWWKYSRARLAHQIFFFPKMAEFWTLVDKDSLTQRFSFVKKLFFLSFYPPWTDSLWKTDDPAVSWRSVEQRCNLAQKWPFSSPNRRGQTLTKFKNILYGVYWDQYQDSKIFATYCFWAQTGMDSKSLSVFSLGHEQMWNFRPGFDLKRGSDLESSV